VRCSQHPTVLYSSRTLSLLPMAESANNASSMLRCLSPDAYSSADCRLPLVNIASACGRRVATAPVMLGGVWATVAMVPNSR
jgi:hypothetical protein